VKNLEKVAKRRPYEYEVNKKDIKLYLEDSQKMPFPIHMNVKKPIVSLDSSENNSIGSKPPSLEGPPGEIGSDLEGDPENDEEMKKLILKKKRKHNIRKSKKHSIFGGPEGHQIQELVVNPNLDLNNLAIENLVQEKPRGNIMKQVSRVSEFSVVPDDGGGLGGEFGLARNRKRSGG